MSRESDPSLTAQAAIWRELDELIEGIAVASRSRISADEFYADAVGGLVRGVAGLGGAVWLAKPNEPPKLSYALNLARSGGPTPELARHGQLANLAMASAKAVLLPPSTTGVPDVGRPDSLLLIGCRFSLDGGAFGVIELVHRPDSSPKAQEGYSHVVEVVAELAGEFHEREAIHQGKARLAKLGQFDEFCDRVHRSLDLRPTAFAIANEGRRLLGCDRVSVAARQRRKVRLMAVSGVDAVDRRSDSARALERLAKIVARTGQAIRFSGRGGEGNEGAPEVQAAIRDYQEAAHSRSLAVLPLVVPEDRRKLPVVKRVVGALILESFGAEFSDSFDACAETAVRHAAIALGNSLEMRMIPASGALRALGRIRWLIPKTLFVAVLIVTHVMAFLWIQKDFKIESRGKLQPVRRAEAFAAVDGAVVEVRMEHGQRVAAGDLLVKMRRPELELEFKRVSGELETARKRLASVEAERLREASASESDRRRQGQLTGLEEELRGTIANLLDQNTLLARQREELDVRAPIAGTVLTWDPEQLLRGRPLRRGQAVATIGDLGGPWQIELHVPDDAAGHVAEARRAAESPLRVTFALAAEPERPLVGRLVRLGERTEVGDDERPFVLAIAEVNAEDARRFTPGTAVSAKIDCGRRSLIYVWFHGLIDTVSAWLALW